MKITIDEDIEFKNQLEEKKFEKELKKFKE